MTYHFEDLLTAFIHEGAKAPVIERVSVDRVALYFVVAGDGKPFSL